jgi:hypothetical protein
MILENFQLEIVRQGTRETPHVLLHNLDPMALKWDELTPISYMTYYLLVL